MNLRLCFQLILLLASISPQVISGAHDRFHIHESTRFPFPQHLVGSRKGHNIDGIKIVKTYLQRYGYLRNNVEITNANVFDENLELALKTYQKFFNLNVSGILDARTLEAMSKPRCGVPDVINKEAGEDNPRGLLYSFFPGEPKWPNTKYNLTYSFVNNFPKHYKRAVSRAIESWGTNSKFIFKEVLEFEAKSDIKLSFEIGDHGDGNPFGPGVLAHAFRPQDGRLHFNGAYAWFDGAFPGRYDMYTVTLHEMGHILGLDHSTLGDAIMFPSIDDNSIKHLLWDDIDGLSRLYRGWV